MSKGRKVIVFVALILAMVVFAGRFMRQDQAYMHAHHVSGNVNAGTEHALWATG